MGKMGKMGKMALGIPIFCFTNCGESEHAESSQHSAGAGLLKLLDSPAPTATLDPMPELPLRVPLLGVHHAIV